MLHYIYLLSEQLKWVDGKPNRLPVELPRILRKSYTAAFKLDAVKFSEEHGTAAAALHFEVDRSMIRRWRREKENLHELRPTKRARRFGKPKATEIEGVLYAWLTQKRASNRAVWRLSVRRRTSVGQPLPIDYVDKCTNFRKFVQNESLHISPHNIGNVDEVPVPFDIVYGRTVDKRGADAVKIDSTGHEKSNFTVVLSVTAAGEKLRKKLIPKENFPPEVVVKANPKGWMNEDLMKMWLDEVWNERPHCSNDPSQSLLILDSARCHLTDSLRHLYKESSKIAVIPGGLTKHLQPLDVGINKPFKDKMKEGWEQWMADTTKASYTASGRRKRMTYSEVAALVCNSFFSISADTIVNSFRRALDLDSQMLEEFEALNLLSRYYLNNYLIIQSDKGNTIKS
ncbi:unnamed protein product [Nippostrongylus brasiliensis]|uniref:Pogo transposable element with KRAB domain (inferred by orthology to a human protein) n=1 Tax=Nippostrongylus brasiliensis TaxID=27835 RepID=A0A0N4XD32_NIPBR|nr:unnamed protein product [Nippostrongylus brasiliensis]